MQIIKTRSGVLHVGVSPLIAARKTLVFINSLGTDFRIWNSVVGLIGDQYNIILHDKAGHGLSSGRLSPSTIADYADDLDAVLRHHNLSEVILCGISVGGLIAQSLAQRKPDLVEGLILSNTGLKIGTTDNWNARIASIKADGISPIADAILERWFSPDFRESRRDELALYRNMLVRTDPNGYIACCEAIRDADFTADARKISAPVLCIAGEHDGSTQPVVVEAMASQIANAKYVLIKDAAHLPCIEQPQIYTRHLTHFIETL